jgi:uncharacterized damage-inducible protein DinB
MKKIFKAKKGDYPEYAEMYMKWLPDDGLILQHLEENFRMVKLFIYGLPPDKLLHRYQPGKWSIKEILVHIIDDERIFAYRALCFARGDQIGLPGFDQDDYAQASEADNRPLDNIFEEYDAVRKATVALYNGLPDNALDRRGNGAGSFTGGTVRALLFHLAGHELHHLNIIREKYL